MIIIFAFLKAYENDSLEKFKGFPPCYLENKENRAIHYLQITTPKSGIQLFLARKPSFPHRFSAELPSRAAAQPLERHRGPEQEILENLIAPVDI